MERNLELCSGMSDYFFPCSFSFLVLCHPAPRRWSRARRMRRPRACVRRSGGVRSPGGCLRRRRKHARERLATPFSNARRTLVHVRPTPSECLRRRPSVSLEHQHSTPVVSHCAAHSFDPGEPSHRSTFFVFFSCGTSYPRSRPPNTFRVFAKASERFFGASTLHACRITLRGAFL
jgi:hypothetical protein